jgi:hypothetical protein
VSMFLNIATFRLLLWKLRATVTGIGLLNAMYKLEIAQPKEGKGDGLSGLIIIVLVKILNPAIEARFDVKQIHINGSKRTIQIYQS